MKSEITRRDLLKFTALLPFSPELIAQCVPAVTHGKFALSAIGWIDQSQPPESGLISPRGGDRLRWLYPSSTIVAGDSDPLGIPDRFVIERASLDSNPENLFDPNPNVGRIPTMIAPRVAWTSVPSLPPPSGLEVLELPVSAQALYFEYSADPCEILVEDEDVIAVTSYVITPGSHFYIEAPEIKRVRFPSALLAKGATNIKLLNLYNDAWLTGKWETIAEIDILNTLRDAANQMNSGGNPLPQDLSRRLARTGNLPPELLEVWKSILQTFRRTVAGDPSLPKGLSPWDVFSLATQATWKASVLSGFGYIDGLGVDPLFPRDSEPSGVHHLEGPSKVPLAYRVRTDDSKQRSNFVIVNPGLAPDFKAPENLLARDFVIRSVSTTLRQVA